MIPFIDLAAQQSRLRARLEPAIARVLAHGQYIMGPEVAAFEKELAAFTGARHAITCANGTDALALALLALNVQAGDAVLVPSFTFAATAEVVPWLGAVPVFVDVREDTFNIDPACMLLGIEAARQHGLRVVGVIAVDLFGQPADYAAIADVAFEHGLWLVADAAQSLGASYHDRPVGRLAPVTTTSFFPAKPLGCYGDGGAVLLENDALAEVIRSLRVHGAGSDKYDNARIGMNSRLDTIQAAILLEKLAILEDEVKMRGDLATRYGARLDGLVHVPHLPDGLRSAWAQYTIRAEERDSLARWLAGAGVPSAIYYRKPLHRQQAYSRFPTAGGLPVSERLSREVLSLPMHPYLEEQALRKITEAVHDWFRTSNGTGR